MKARECRNDAQLVNFMPGMDITFALVLCFFFFLETQPNVNVFLLRSKCFPGAGFHRCHWAVWKACGTVASSQLRLDTFLFLCIVLFVCAYGSAQVPVRLLKVSNVCAPQNLCIWSKVRF